MSQLRRALDEPALIGSGHGGYTLDLDAGGVDVLQVASLAATASAARRSGDASAALEAATEALGLFRGDILVDAGDGEWLHPHRTRLEEVRLGLLEDQAAARVDLGAGGDVIAELEWLLGRHPLREGLWSSLITALYRAGRQADALAAYQRARRLFLDELGIEPGKALRQLERQILEQSSALDAAAAVAGTAPALVVGNLPTLSTPLVGRADDLSAIGRLIDGDRLVTLVGPAGVGKTRAAIEAVRPLRPSGGVWLVRLEAADATTSISRMVAEALQLTGGEQTLLDRVAGAETVLVLDNCEHVIDGVADLATRLLDQAAPLRIVATSQAPLGVDGEATYALDPLPLSDSVTLFADRAARTRRQFALDDDTAATVEAVCRSLDGLPLAIELAAARVKSLSVQEIARRLDDRFNLLQDPTSRRPERRRALAAAIGWSYDLLFPDDQRGLWALSCFAGGAPLAAAEQVLTALGVPDVAAVDVIGRLADRSMLSVETADDGATRYRLLDSIRAFAGSRLEDAGLADDASAAHASWFAQAAEECDATIRTRAQPACLALVRAERANIDAALAWAARHDPQLGLRLANGFGWTWVVLGDGVAGAARARDALDAARLQATPHEQATALLLAGWLEASAGNVGQAQDDLDAALAAAERLGDDRLRADAHRHLAFLRIQQGRPHDVLECAAASLVVYRRLDLPWETAASLLLGAFGSIMLGDTVGATRSATEAVRLLTPIGDAWGMVHAEAMLGAVANAEHRFADAAAALTRAAALSESLGFVGQAALHLTTLGRVQQRAGATEQALDTLARAIRSATTGGDLRIAATARIHLARGLRRSGDQASARTLLEENDRWYRASGGGDGALLTRAALAAMSVGADTGAAVHDLHTVLDEARHHHDLETQTLALDALARAAVTHGDPQRAAQLLQEADTLHAQVRHTLDDADRIDASAVRHP
ncbi:MAG TPA: BTAD domain-containing putative transcriptional regulator [Actinomycetota bacterium]|nr:BTAD domain-containing putative transcriptional regulator [Actinomycetota bacterium]